MKILGLNISFGRKMLQSVSAVGSGAWKIISEPFAGAWQRNIEEKQGDVITYPTLYACISRISSDIGKLPFRVRELDKDDIWKPSKNKSFNDLLMKPNSFQTPVQFREFWLISKLTQGNCYLLKRRDNERKVVQLFILDPTKVLPMVSASGQVFYQLQVDPLNSLPLDYPAENLIVPASEIIHDRCMPLHHPLIGVPPLAAAHWPSIKNFKIMKSATEFFANNSQPGGLLTAPAGMSEEDSDRVRDYWNKNFVSGNNGKVAVIGADMKFTPFAMKSIDSQMVEQMRYSDEQICQPFGIPPFKVGIGTIPSGLGVDGLNQLYYSDALQTHIEHMENLLNDGLEVPKPVGIFCDLEPLLRMDEGKRAEVAVKLVKGGVDTPNEGRARFNRSPLEGGDTVYMQRQDIPLEQARLNKSDTTPVATEVLEVTEDKSFEEVRAFLNTQKAIAAMNKEITHV